MERPEHQEMTSDSGEERPASDPGSTQPPTLPPRVEPAPAPRLDRPPEVEERLIPLDALDEDDTFQLRAAGDVGRLAMDLARLGQAFPVDVRRREGSDRFQLVAGFRRVAALRFLQRT